MKDRSGIAVANVNVLAVMLHVGSRTDLCSSI